MLREHPVLNHLHPTLGNKCRTCHCLELRKKNPFPYNFLSHWITMNHANKNNVPIATKFFIFLFWKTFKIICKILLQIFYILLDSWNILTKSNDLSAILDYWGYACHVTSGVTQVFHLESQWSIGTQSSFLVAI